MPRKLRNPKVRTDILTHGQVAHLIHGYDFFGDGYGRENPDEDVMREDWNAHREIVEAARRADRTRAHWPIYAALRFDAGLSHEDAQREITRATKLPAAVTGTIH